LSGLSAATCTEFIVYGFCVWSSRFITGNRSLVCRGYWSAFCLRFRSLSDISASKTCYLRRSQRRLRVSLCCCCGWLTPSAGSFVFGAQLPDLAGYSWAPAQSPLWHHSEAACRDARVIHVLVFTDAFNPTAKRRYSSAECLYIVVLNRKVRACMGPLVCFANCDRVIGDAWLCVRRRKLLTSKSCYGMSWCASSPNWSAASTLQAQDIVRFCISFLVISLASFLLPDSLFRRSRWQGGRRWC
jgi:hypothetical protein